MGGERGPVQRAVRAGYQPVVAFVDSARECLSLGVRRGLERGNGLGGRLAVRCPEPGRRIAAGIDATIRRSRTFPALERTVEVGDVDHVADDLVNRPLGATGRGLPLLVVEAPAEAQHSFPLAGERGGDDVGSWFDSMEAVDG